MSETYFLPSKVAQFLRRLTLNYGSAKKPLHAAVIRDGRFAVRENTSYDNWMGGITGHDVHLFVPDAVMKRMDLDLQAEVQNAILEDLNRCGGYVDGEAFRAVNIELVDDNDPLYQASAAVDEQTGPAPETVKFWKPGHVRVFVSHKDKWKVEAKALSEALEAWGISAFVAHDTIEPMEKWQTEIEKGLQTMEIMLVFLTDDFHEGPWTNQEVGFALGRGTPIIAVKMQRADPCGFLMSEQAVRGDIASPTSCLPKVVALIADKLGQADRMRQAAIAAFCAVPDFYDVQRRFHRMKDMVETLTEGERAQIIDGYAANPALHNAFYLNNQHDRLKTFLEKATGENVTIKGKVITIRKPKPELADIPF